MAVAAGARQFETGTVESGGERGPKAIRVDRMETDRDRRLEATRFIGEVLTETETTVEFLPEDEMSLLGAIKECSKGNLSAMPNVRKNVMTAAQEGIYKAGHVIKIQSDITDATIIQHGQSHKAVYRNALRYTSKFRPMAARTHAETLNGHRIEHLAKTGVLKDHYLLVVSLCPDDMTIEQMQDHSFFTENMTAVLQATTIENGQLVTESAFWAGAKSKNAPRHDFAAVKKLYKHYNEDASDIPDTTQLLAHPILIAKKDMPDGVINPVQLLDSYVGGFFGKGEPKQDYKEFLRVCAQREAKLNDTVAKIVQDLVASADELHDPIDAIRKLYQLTKKHALAYVVQDPDIDVSVFGPQAEAELLQAREFLRSGDIAAMHTALEKATDSAIFTMCEGGEDKKAKKITDSESLETKKLGETNALEDKEDDKSGRIRCFKCHSWVDKKAVVKEKTWCCPKCNYEVDVCDGKVVSEGNEKAEDNHEDATVHHMEDMFLQKQIENIQISEEAQIPEGLDE